MNAFDRGPTPNPLAGDAFAAFWVAINKQMLTCGLPELTYAPAHAIWEQVVSQAGAEARAESALDSQRYWSGEASPAALAVDREDIARIIEPHCGPGYRLNSNDPTEQERRWTSALDKADEILAALV